MKKIFTLFCALTLMLGTNVAQTAPKAFSAKKAQVAVEQMQEVQLEKPQLQQAQAEVALKSDGTRFKPLQAQNFNQLSAAPALTVNNPKASVVKSPKAMKAAKEVARRAAATAKTVATSTQNTAVTIGKFSASTAFEGEYYVIMTDAASSTQFIFDISTDNFELGKTYTWSDMIDGYTGIGDANDYYAWTVVTDASYTETKDQDGYTHVVASMTDEDGTTYDITYDQLPPQDIDVTAVDWTYDGEYYDVYVRSETTTYLFELKEDLVLGKTYTFADMAAKWTGTVVDIAGYYYIDIAATDATLTVTKDQDELVHIAATMVLNGDTHKITYDEKAFAPTGVKIDVEGTDLNGRYLSSFGFYLYTATWGDYTIQLAFDAEEEKASYTNDDLLPNYSLIYSNNEEIPLFKLASDNITITNTETTKTLAGSIYAKNGDEYVLNLVYEEPDAKYIDINVQDADLTNWSTIGFWTIGGQTADKIHSFNIYFISKALQGTWTDIEKFDSYSTWVSDNSTSPAVYYQNLSEVNLTSAIVEDSLVVEGTLNLADDSGNPAIVTVHISTPFTQTWGEWADFAPFDLNTGKYVFSAMFNSPTTQANIPVQVRKDNTGLKQYKFIGWGKNIFTATGIDLIVDMGPDNVCTVSKQDLGLDPGYGENIQVQDLGSKTGQDVPSTYDPETGVFKLALSYFISLGSFGSDYETMTMDQPILERDTVKVTSDMKFLAEPTKGIIKVSGEDDDFTYILEVVGTDTLGTFSLANGTLGQKYYYGIVGKQSSTKLDYTEGEVTISKDETVLKLAGLMIGADEKAYVFDWTYTPITERDTIDIISNTMYYNDFIASNKAVQYYAGEDAEGYSTFLVTSKNATSVEGTFDIYLGYSFANTDEGNQIGFEQGQFTVASEEKGIRLTGWVIGDDEKYYRLNWYKQTVFDERDTVKVNSSTLSTFYQESIQGYVYQSSNADYELIQFVTKSSEKLGTFKFSDLQAGYTIFRTNDGDYVEFQDGEITVSEDEEGLKLTGLLIGKDEKAYVINIIQPAGTLESDTDAPFDDAFDYTDMTASINEGTITITAVKSGLSQMKLVLYADPAATEIPEGTYTISDSKEAGTALQSTGYGATGATPCYAATLVKIDGKTYLDDMWFMVDGSVTLSYDEYGKLKVEVDAKNSYNQPVTALVKYEKIEPKGTVTIEANTLQIYDDLAESYGVYEYYAENENYAIDLYADSETPDGTFDETNIEFGACTIYDAEGNKFGVFEGEFTVTLNGKNSTLTGSVLGKDTILYELNLKGFQGAIPGDAQEAFTATYSTEDISDAFSSKAKMHVLSACNEAGDSIHIVFKSSQDPLEARTYEITTSGSMNTVIASDGTATSLNAVSFAAKKNDGEIDQLWHMVSGTVVIGEDGSITVNALNSYDQTITINVNVPLPDYYLYSYSTGKYLGWNGASTDKNKIALMDEASRMPVTVTLSDEANKRFTTSVTATDDKNMYLSAGSGFNFHSGSPYAGEQDNGSWYKIKDLNASTIEAEKVAEIEEGAYYIIVHNYNGYMALSSTIVDTDGQGKMRIIGYKLASAGDKLTFAFKDIEDCIYRYVTATTPAPEPRPTEEPVVEGNILDEESFNFNGGTVGQWKSAGTKDAELSTVAPGYNNSAYAMKVTTAEGGQVYDTQVKYVGQYINGHTYSYSFKAKASAAVNMQVALQQDGFPFQGNYSETIALTTEWAEYSGKLTVTNDNYVRFLLNVGETAADYFFDQIVLIDETATSVMPLMMNNDDAIYTVSGQRVIEPVKGEIYIINGQQTLFE